MSQVWLITGTSSGLGSELVKEVIARGDKVIATARNIDWIAHFKEIGALTMQLDVTASQIELDQKAKEAISLYGRVDVLINNAGYTQFGTVEETNHDEWFTQFNTNVFGTLNTTRSFLPHMRGNKSGQIIFVGSMVAWDGLPALGAYCASKAALHYAVESLSKELASTVIKTLLIEPGSFRTELLNPQNRKNVPTKIEDYRVLCETVKSQFASLHHNQPGDPTKGSHRIIDIVKGENDAAGKVWPTSLALGSDAIGTIHKTCEDMLCELGAWETFSASTDI